MPQYFLIVLIISILNADENNMQSSESVENDASDNGDDGASTEGTKVININDIDIDVDWGDFDKTSDEKKGMWQIFHIQT